MDIKSRTNQNIVGGIDDATKCPCIGSIFIAGVVADIDTLSYWREVGVKDSKLIAPKKREQLAHIIKETATHTVIKALPPALIDNKQLNLNQWEMAVALQIAHLLHINTNMQTIHIDNWEVNTACFNRRFADMIDPARKEILSEHAIPFDRKKVQTLSLIPEHRADETHTIVGAASILAKTASDAEYAQHKEAYGDFGSGSPADPKTRLFVWNQRHNPVPIIRTSWQTFKTLSRLSRIEDDAIYGRIKKKA